MFDVNFQEEHEEEFHRKETCPYCKADFPAADFRAHENNCPSKPRFCEYCELSVPVSEFPAHLKACESRTKQCEKCRKPIPNKDYLVHLVSCPGIIEEPEPRPIVREQ